MARKRVRQSAELVASERSVVVGMRGEMAEGLKRDGWVRHGRASATALGPGGTKKAAFAVILRQPRRPRLTPQPGPIPGDALHTYVCTYIHTVARG